MNLLVIFHRNGKPYEFGDSKWSAADNDSVYWFVNSLAFYLKR